MTKEEYNNMLQRREQLQKEINLHKVKIDRETFKKSPNHKKDLKRVKSKQNKAFKNQLLAKV